MLTVRLMGLLDPKRAAELEMTDFLKTVTFLSSSRVRNLLSGIGYGFDPIPRLYHDTFCESDFAARAADWEALYLDWWWAHCRLAEQLAQKSTETHDGLNAWAKSRRTEQREPEVA